VDSKRARAEGAIRDLRVTSADILERLGTILEARKQADPRYSYVSGLYGKGLDAILKKVGEEATEVVMAAKDGEAQRIVHEAADLWFHCLILLAYKDISPAAILAELDRRFGQSGVAEAGGRVPQP